MSAGGYSNLIHDRKDEKGEENLMSTIILMKMINADYDDND